MKMIIKRVYEPYSSDDGFRILIDRFWPRGISKEKANIDFWDKNLAPSTELRKWFNHEPEKFEEFKKRYEAELDQQKEALAELLKKIQGKKKLSLIYGAKDPEVNHASVFRAYLLRKLK